MRDSRSKISEWISGRFPGRVLSDYRWFRRKPNNNRTSNCEWKKRVRVNTRGSCKKTVERTQFRNLWKLNRRHPGQFWRFETFRTSRRCVRAYNYKFFLLLLFIAFGRVGSGKVKERRRKKYKK